MKKNKAPHNRVPNKHAFRVWDSVNKYYLDDTELCNMMLNAAGELCEIDYAKDEFGNIYDEIEMISPTSKYFPNRYHVEQYTGVSDLEGKPIFENDLLIKKNHETGYAMLLAGQWAIVNDIEHCALHGNNKYFKVMGTIHTKN